MSRSGYTDDCEEPGLWLYRGAVRSATYGKRGQRLLSDLLVALDAMPVKELVSGVLVEDGEFCALGVLGQVRGFDLAKLDPNDWDTVAEAFDIAPALAREIVYENDEGIDEWEWIEVAGPPRGRWNGQPSISVPRKNVNRLRWERMRAWVAKQIQPQGVAA